MEILQRLASLSDQGNIDPLSIALDGRLVFTKRQQPTCVNVSLDGVTYSITLISDPTGTSFEIIGRIGHIPFSAEDPIRREQVLAILKAAKQLSHSRFVLDKGNCIVACHKGHEEGDLHASDLMYGFVQFVQESRPFLRLLATVL